MELQTAKHAAGDFVARQVLRLSEQTLATARRHRLRSAQAAAALPPARRGPACDQSICRLRLGAALLEIDRLRSRCSAPAPGATPIESTRCSPLPPPPEGVSGGVAGSAGSPAFRGRKAYAPPALGAALAHAIDQARYAAEVAVLRAYPRIMNTGTLVDVLV